MDERVEQRLLEQEPERAHQRIERPTEDPGLALGIARGLHERLEIGHRRVRLECAIVDEDAELLLDHAEEVDTRERVEPEVVGERRLLRDRGGRFVRDLRHD